MVVHAYNGILSNGNKLPIDETTWMKSPVHSAKWKKPDAKTAYHGSIYDILECQRPHLSTYLLKASCSVWLPAGHIHIAFPGMQCPPHSVTNSLSQLSLSSCQWTVKVSCKSQGGLFYVPKKFYIHYKCHSDHRGISQTSL